MNYTQACAFLESLQKLDTPLEYMKERKRSDLEKYLLRMQELLDRLGNPERDMKYIHVTGTAGKGTTTAYIHNGLHGAGYCVGSISSPAVTATIERIRVGEHYIAPQEFADIVSQMQPVIRDMYMNSPYGKPSYFDCMLAISLLFFQQSKCEWVVLEVGMGGRYDSTNVIKNVYASLITCIDFDHTHLLGNTLEEIAYEKAGIIKSDSLFFTTESQPELRDMFQDICSKKNTVYTQIESADNQALATAVLKSLDVEQEIITQVLNETQLPCRFEQVQVDPFVILDGAHNPVKVNYSLQKLENMEYKKLHVLFACGDTKDAQGMLDSIADFAHHITLTFSPAFQRKAFSLKKLHTYITETYPHISFEVSLDAHAGYEGLENMSTDKDIILVIGSLFLTGDIRRRWYPEEYILNTRKSF